MGKVDQQPIRAELHNQAPLITMRAIVKTFPGTQTLNECAIEKKRAPSIDYSSE